MAIMKDHISLVKDELNRNMTAAVLPVTIFIGIEAFVGLFGNILILFIYSKRYKHSNFRYIVLSLAVVDLTSCCTTLPGEIFSQLNWYDYKYGWICKVKSYFNVFTAWESASILLILSYDRYRKICHPLSWQIQPSAALRACGISFILSSLVSIPVTIFWGKQTYLHEVSGANLTVSVCGKSDEYANGIYPLMYICIVYIFPITLMVFVAGSLNFVTAKTLFGQSTLEVPSKRQSISVTTLTAVTLDTDLLGNRGLTITGDKSRQELPNRFSGTSNVLWSAMKTFENVCTNFDSGSRKVEYSKNNKLNRNDDLSVEFKSYTYDNCSQSYKGENHKIEPNTKARTLKPSFHPKQKTVIMLVLTTVFVFSMSIYVILTSFVAKPDGILRVLSNTEKVVFFFFWRLYFVNSMINPILYGFMDPRFRSGLLSFVPIYTLKNPKTKKAAQTRYLPPSVKF